MTTTPDKVGLIYELMPKIMADIPVITKDRKNQGQGYQFRSVDDAYNTIHPVLVKHGVIVPMEVVDEPIITSVLSKSGGSMTNIVLRLRARFTAKDGSFVESEAVGQGIDQGDKAAAKAQSMAIKQIFFETFAIPTDDPTKDAENDDPDPIITDPGITADQKLVIAKLLDDKKRNMEDVEAVIEKVCDYYKIKNFPVDLTSAQASIVISKWSKKAAK